MTWALLSLLAAVTIAFVTQTFLGRKDVRELLACRDLLDGEREQLRVVRAQLASEEAAHAVTSKRFNEERELRAVAESQRNDALRRLQSAAAQLEKGSVADAISTIDALLAEHAGVPNGEATVPAGDPDRTDDDLLAP